MYKIVGFVVWIVVPLLFGVFLYLYMILPLYRVALHLQQGFHQLDQINDQRKAK
jgi:hypothetical protein